MKRTALLARLRALFRRDAIVDEIREEMDFHLDMRASEYAGRGVDPQQARRDARHRFGNVAVLRDKGYDVRGGGLMESIWQDVKYGARSLRQSPTFTIVALTVLTLAIGAGTAIFSVVDAVALRGLPYDEADRIAAVLGVNTRSATTFGSGTTTTQTYLDWRRMQQSFDGVAMVSPTGFTAKTERGEPAPVFARRVTWEFFPILRVTPALGRLLTADDEVPGNEKVAVLSHAYWLSRFGGNPQVIGQSLTLGTFGARESWRIVGVAPRGFSYPPSADHPTELYVPQVFRDFERVRAGGRSYNATVIGRLKPGVTLGRAKEQMDTVATSLEAQYPKWEPGWRTNVVPLHEQLVGTTRNWMLLLLGAVGVVMLIACANVGNLMLARATTRAREVGIRAALGAGRGRIARALLIESLLLSITAGALGVALAFAGVAVLRAWLPAGTPRIADIAVDLRVLGAAIVASLATGTLFGLAPAIHASRASLTGALKDGDRASTSGRAVQHLRRGFVVAEIALAVVLLAGAGLFVASFVKLARIEPGFNYRNTIVVSTTLQRNPTKDPSYQTWLDGQAYPYVKRVLATVAAVPGVSMVGGMVGGLPLTTGYSRVSIWMPGGPELKDDVDFRRITPNYFEILGVPLLKGRTFNNDDALGRTTVAVINESAARRYWPNRDPLGERFTMQGKERVIVGVVADIRQYGPETPPHYGVFVPFDQERTGGIDLMIRTETDPMRVLPAIKSAIWSLNPDQVLSADIVTLEGHMDRLVAPRRFNMALLTLLGALGLVIAAVGIFGVMAYTVAQRTAEIGVRLAMGATPRRILTMVLKDAGVLIGMGLIIGAAAAWQLTSFAEAFLFQIKPTDTRVFAVVMMTLALVGLAAAAVPARRAARVDPLKSLRES
jgi:putative ABC transport system permease protein